MIPGRQIGKNGLLELATGPVTIANAFSAAGRAVKAVIKRERVMVSDDEQERRMAICATCEFFTGTTCRKCGCHIRFKSKLQTEHCPIGKW